VPQSLEDVDFAADALNIRDLLDTRLLQDFDGHALARDDMGA
jgi:hypothetical protein